MTLFYAEHIAQVPLLWGPFGQKSASEMLGASPWSPIAMLWQTTAGSYTAYFLALAISIAFAIGLLPRITAPLFLLASFTMFVRNDAVLDGGQNILMVIATYLCFADTSWYGSLVKIRVPLPASLRVVPVILHNAAMTMVTIQISIVYFYAGAFKMMGHMWQDGTALYYIMRDDAFSWYASPFFYSNATFVTLATYGTMFVEIGFALFLWNKRLRLVFLALILFMHVGIAIFMGLTLFAAIMIAIDIAILTDSDVSQLRHHGVAIRQWFSNLTARLHNA